MSGREQARFESETVYRRRLIKDICAATGWVFLTQASRAHAADPKVEGDSTNGDKSGGIDKERIAFDGEVPVQKEIEREKLNLATDDLQ